MGVPWHDSGTIGSLLGTRMVLNEFIAYSQLGPLKASLDPVSAPINPPGCPAPKGASPLACEVARYRPRPVSRDIG